MPNCYQQLSLECEFMETSELLKFMCEPLKLYVQQF